MAIYSILPSKNLRYQDIRDTLNANGGTVGNTSADANNAWSAAAKINMWSRWKPVRLNTPVPLTDSDFKSVTFGLKFGTLDYNTPIEAAQVSVTYEAPRGGAFNEPFRIGDFRNYSSEANPPISGLTDMTFYKAFQESIGFPYQDNTEGAYSISIQELTFLRNYYVGIAIYDGNTLVNYKTESSNIETGGNGAITFNKADFGSHTGNLSYCCIACQNPRTDGQASYTNNMFRPLPFSGVSEATKNLTISNSIHINITPVGISAVTTSIYDDINDYSPIASVDPQNWILNSFGNCNIIYEFVPNINFSLAPNSFTFSANPTFANATGTGGTGDIIPSIYQITGSTSTQITTSTFTLYQGTTYKLLFQVPELMSYKNGTKVNNMVTGTKTVVFSIKYLNNLIHQSMSVNIRKNL